ncbi:hypothetical protein [Sulfurimonas sp. C5]|uniref:hypothetical protein n=1 Tax=Sulfurimonas sp. C5 TaxID=3036947 RepID=UPI00245767B2|nr:hypothetical protein [Sulfurimonas sp. C5]MDH4944740.1 hypothetical protein [Sulfurimonas sp. C5]
MYDVNNDEQVYVVTYKELLFTLVVFIIILFALFPKGILKDQISADKSNYDLSMVYLKDLLKHSPDDESLQILLLEKSVHAGDINTAMQLSKKLLSSENEYVRHKALLFAYESKKAKYYSLDDVAKQRPLYPELQRLFNTIYKDKLYDTDIEKWYKEAVFAQNQKAAYFFLQKLLQQDPRNVKYLTDGYYLSLDLYKRSDSVKYITALEQYDSNNSLKWAMDKYTIFMRYKDYKNAELLLEHYAKQSLDMQLKLANFYLMIQKYEDASNTYLELFYITKDEKVKKEYLVKSIRALQSGNLLKKAAFLVHHYESQYIHDRDMRKFFLKIYLAAGELEYASELSKKILKNENKL